MNKGKLILLPNVLDGNDHALWLAPIVTSYACNIPYLIAESEKGAWRFLRRCGRAPKTFPDPEIMLLNEHSAQATLGPMLQPCMLGHDIGLISDAGLPAVADPGAALVQLAHEKQIQVVPMPGPSAIFQALMVSGFNGQQFTFNGYLPVDEQQCSAKLYNLEKEVAKGYTQLCIETPYRNLALAKRMAKLNPNLGICIVLGINSPTESVIKTNVKHLESYLPAIDKRPAIFILGKPMA